MAWIAYLLDIIKIKKCKALSLNGINLLYSEKSDTYYCMLFNDEVHTYEQVIYTLQKAVNCTQKEAIFFATTVDRDVSNFLVKILIKLQG